MNPDIAHRLLPEDLQELDEKTNIILANAIEIQGEVNAAAVTSDKRRELGAIAICELDRQAKGVFVNEIVQITGSYRRPIITVDNENMQQTMMPTYGSVRGRSHGFIGQIIQNNDAPEDTKYILEHLIATGRREYITKASSIAGDFYAKASIDGCSLVLGSVEDHLQKFQATQDVRLSAKDDKWIQRFDQVLSDDSGINFRRLGKHLVKLNLSRAHRTDDFISYINAMLDANTRPPVSLKCDYFVECLDDQATIIRNPPMISGNFDGVIYGPNYRFGKGAPAVVEIERPVPMLLVTSVLDSNPNAIARLQIPLSKIRDFTIDV